MVEHQSLSEFLSLLELGLDKKLTKEELDMAYTLFENGVTARNAIRTMGKKTPPPSGPRDRIFEAIGNTVVEVTGLPPEEEKEDE